MYTALSILFLCIEAALIGGLGYLIFKKKAAVDKGSLIYVVPVFICVYALYLTGMIYSGEPITFYSLFLLIHETLSMVSMELNEGMVAALSEANAWYHAATIGACILSLATVIFSIFALFGATIANEARKKKRFAKGCDIVIGVSPSALKYLENHKDALLWAECIEKEEYRRLVKQQYAVHKAPLTEKNVSKRLRGEEYHLIVFRDANYSYFSILSCFEGLKANKDKRLFLHLEVDVNEMEIFREKYLSEISAEANSFLLPFCRYELMARRFIIEHPITKYIPKSFFNDNFTLKEDKEINVVFLGFGKVNYELFKQMVTNFQFAKQKEGKLCAAPVHYYTFENNGERFNNEYFITLLNEYEEIFKGSDLPPADKICDLKEILPMDAHSGKTRKQLLDLVKENTYTYFVISLSEDFEDGAFAYELKKHLADKDNYKIFVRAKGEESRLLNKGEESVIYFGEDDECLLHENIINDDLMVLSQNVNNLYNDYTQDKWAQLREWQKLPVVEQYSNINAALNIYFKLHLMGFDLQKGRGMGVSKEEFEELLPDVFMRENGEDYQYFFGTKAANVLAFIEHARWNAYYILSGYKPLAFKEFVWKKNSKGREDLLHKNRERLRHACLTSYQGLDELIQYKYKTLKEESEKGERAVGQIDFNAQAAIYRYDYMVVDGMYDALSGLGYSIVQRKDK